jgi:hypothetical protein
MTYRRDHRPTRIGWGVQTGMFSGYDCTFVLAATVYYQLSQEMPNPRFKPPADLRSLYPGLVIQTGHGRCQRSRICGNIMWHDDVARRFSRTPTILPVFATSSAPSGSIPSRARASSQGLKLVHFSAQREQLSGTLWVISVTKTAQGELRSGRVTGAYTRLLLGST